MIRFLLAVALCACPAAQIHAQVLSTVPPSTALLEPPAGTNTVLVIRAGDLGDRTIVLEINGSKVADLKSNQSHTGVYSPGRLRFSFADTTMDAYAIANEEHVYELQIAAPKGPVAARPVLVLKERKTIIAGYVAPQETKPQPQSPPPPPEVLAVEVSEPPSRANVKIAVVGAGDHSYLVEINGRRIPAVGPGVTYSAVYTPGTIEIIVTGRNSDATARMLLAPNQEYVFEVSPVPGRRWPRIGFQGWRDIAEMAKTPEPTILLKRSTIMFAVPKTD